MIVDTEQELRAINMTKNDFSKVKNQIIHMFLVRERILIAADSFQGFTNQHLWNQGLAIQDFSVIIPIIRTKVSPPNTMITDRMIF